MPRKSQFQYTVENMKKAIRQESKQLEILKWTEDVLRPLADSVQYEKLCNFATENKIQEFVLSPNLFKEVFNRMYPFAAGGTPGHDRGHHLRDILQGAAIIGKDPTVAKGCPSEVIAGIFAAAYHDSSCAIIDRYKDNVGYLSHTEVAAWLFFFMTEDLLPEYIRRLTAYAIAAHQHALGPVTTGNNFVRQPWVDHLFYSMDRPMRIAPWLVRFSDRLDNNGATLLAREIVAKLDSYVYKGEDITGSATYVADDVLLRVMLKPAVMMDGKAPSALQHIVNYGNSNDRNLKISAYNQHDQRFPQMGRLITMKSKQSFKIVEAVSKTKPEGRSLLDALQSKQKVVFRPLDPDFFWAFLKKVAATEDVEAVHTSFNTVWKNLTNEEQSHWVDGVKFAESQYTDWVARMKYEVRSATLPVIQTIAPVIMEIVSDL